MAREVKIAFLGDTSDLHSATNKATDDLDTFSKRAGVVGGVAAGVTTAALNAVGAAAKGVASFMGGALKEAEEAAQIGRVTGKLIETTGNAANVTAEHVSTLTESLSNMSGIDDEVIQAGTNVMLTFKNVRNEAGKGNDVFDRSQRAALDLSAVLGTDLASANVQLGKALNDPIKGVTSLGKAGVQFTEEQKAMIESLVKSGDVLGAQKIILGEVEGQVGGAAEANATASQRMATAWGNLKENIGTLILPAFTALTDWFTNSLFPIITEFVDYLAPKFSAAFDIIGDVVGALVDAFSAGFDTGDVTGNLNSFAGAIELIGSAVGVGVKKTMEFLVTLGDWCRNNTDLLKTAAIALGSFAAAMATIGALHTGATAVTNLTSSLGAVVTTLGPWGLIVLAVIAVGAAAVYAYQHFKPFRQAVDDVVDAVGDAIDWFDRLGTIMKIVVGGAALVFAPLLAVIGAVVLAIRHWDSIVETAQRVWAGVQAAIQAVLDFIMPIVAAAVEFLVSAWQRYGDEVTGILTALVELFVAVWERIVQVINIVVAVLTPAWELIAGAWKIALQAIQTAVGVFIAIVQQAWALWGDELFRVVKIAFDFIKNAIEGALRVIQGIIQVVTGLIKGDWGQVWDGLKNIVSGAWQGIQASLNAVMDFFRTVWSGLTSLITAPFDAAHTAIKRLLDGFAGIIRTAFDAVEAALKSGINSLIDIMNAAIRGYNSIPLAPNLPEIPNVRGGPSANGSVGVHSMAAYTTPSLMRAMQTRNAALSAVPVSGGTVTINMHEGANGHAVVEAIRRYERRNGQARWRTR